MNFKLLKNKVATIGLYCFMFFIIIKNIFYILNNFVIIYLRCQIIGTYFSKL